MDSAGHLLDPEVRRSNYGKYKQLGTHRTLLSRITHIPNSIERRATTEQTRVITVPRVNFKTYKQRLEEWKHFKRVAAVFKLFWCVRSYYHLWPLSGRESTACTYLEYELSSREFTHHGGPLP